MVHALEKTHELLAPDGVLIDIHPTVEHPQIEVHIDGRVWVAGYLDEPSGFAKYSHATEALETVVERGLFIVEQTGEFVFLTHANTPDEYVHFIRTEWSKAILEDKVIRRMKGFFDVPGEKKTVVMREATHITRLRAGRTFPAA